MTNMPNTLDLFCGCGGLSLGFEQAGFNIKVANDKWKVAVKTYKKNFENANVVSGDITKEDIKRKIIDNCGNNIDVVIGGPPCQAYSLAGTRDPKDPRGQLVKSYADIVEKIKPKVIVIENVPGILSMKHFKKDTPSDIIEEYNELVQKLKSENRKVSIDKLSEDFEGYLKPVSEIIKEEFEEYTIEDDLLNSADYGVPQVRKRVFFIGVRNDLAKGITKKDMFPPVTHNKNGADGLKKYVTLGDVIGSLPFPEIGENDEVHIGDFSFIYKSRNRRRALDELSFTIQASGRHAPLHPKSPPMTKVGTDKWLFGKGPQRRLSVREIAKIQTFPNDFIFTGSTAHKYKQIGNAVPPTLSKNVAMAVKKILQKAKL